MKSRVLFLLILMIIVIRCFSERTIDKSKIHSEGNLELRVNNNGTIGSNGENFPSLEYPANSGIDRLRIGSLWFGAKKVRRNGLGQRLYWLHNPPLSEDDVVTESDIEWSEDLELVVDSLTSVGYDEDNEIYELLPAYNPLETGIHIGHYQEYNNYDIVLETSTHNFTKGYDDDGDSLIDEDPAGMAFPLRESSNLPEAFEDFGGLYIHDIYDNLPETILDNANIWQPLDFLDLSSDPSNGYYSYTRANDDDCDGLVDEDGYAVSEQDFISYYYDYSPFNTSGQRDFGAGSEENEHYPLKIAVREITHQWSFSYLRDAIYLEFSITNMNPWSTLYDCAAGIFMDPEIGPQSWSESERRYDDMTTYRTVGDHEFAYSYDCNEDMGTSRGYLGTMLCSPKPADMQINCWTWEPGNGPDDSNPHNIDPESITANEKYALLSGINPDYERFSSIKENPPTPPYTPCDTRYLYTFAGDMQGFDNPTDYSWNIEPSETVKIVIAIFAGDSSHYTLQGHAERVFAYYGAAQGLSESCEADTNSHYTAAFPPAAPNVIAEKTEDNAIEIYWDNRSEIDNLDTQNVCDAFMGWQETSPELDSYIDNWDENTYPTEFAPYYYLEYSGEYIYSEPVNRNESAIVNPWTAYRLRHDFQAYTVCGRPASYENFNWIEFEKYDKIETEQDIQDYIVNYWTESFIDFGGESGLDRGLPNPHTAESEDFQYYHYNEKYEPVPYEAGETVYGYPLYDAETVWSEALEDIANSLDFESQALLFKHPDVSDEIYLALYSDRLIPLFGHLGQSAINDEELLEQQRINRLSSRYYHETIDEYSFEEELQVTVSAWDRGMPSINMPPLESNKSQNANIISHLPQDFLIWPGDTNLDGAVNAIDIESIAVNFGAEGNARDYESYIWQGNEMQDNWNNPEAMLADCNGDGIVSITDVMAICYNWGKTHEAAAVTVTFSESDYIDNRERFLELYESLDNFGIESKIKAHIAEILGLPYDEIISNALYDNFPNPFNPSTNIRYSISEESDVSLKIYNIKGQLVKTFKIKAQEAGYHRIIWNGIDNRNKKVSCGVYFYRLAINGNSIKTRKMVLLK